MAQVSFSHDATPRPIDETLDRCAAAAANAEKPLRCRLQPDLYNHEHAGYNAWAGLVWSVDLRDVEEGRRLREGLADYFRAFGGSAEQQERLLKGLKKIAGEPRG